MRVSSRKYFCDSGLGCQPDGPIHRRETAQEGVYDCESDCTKASNFQHAHPHFSVGVCVESTMTSSSQGSAVAVVEPNQDDNVAFYNLWQAWTQSVVLLQQQQQQQTSSRNNQWQPPDEDQCCRSCCRGGRYQSSAMRRPRRRRVQLIWRRSSHSSTPNNKLSKRRRRRCRQPFLQYDPPVDNAGGCHGCWFCSFSSNPQQQQQQQQQSPPKPQQEQPKDPHANTEEEDSCGSSSSCSLWQVDITCSGTESTDSNNSFVLHQQQEDCQPPCLDPYVPPPGSSSLAIVHEERGGGDAPTDTPTTPSQRRPKRFTPTTTPPPTTTTRRRSMTVRQQQVQIDRLCRMTKQEHDKALHWMMMMRGRELGETTTHRNASASPFLIPNIEDKLQETPPQDPPKVDKNKNNKNKNNNTLLPPPPPPPTEVNSVRDGDNDQHLDHEPYTGGRDGESNILQSQLQDDDPPNNDNNDKKNNNENYVPPTIVPNSATSSTVLSSSITRNHQRLDSNSSSLSSLSSSSSSSSLVAAPQSIRWTCNSSDSSDTSGDDCTRHVTKTTLSCSRIAHDEDDPVGTPLLSMTNVWNPHSSSAVSPCHPNRNNHTAKDNKDEEECIVFDSDDEEECIIFDSDDEEECMVLESPPSLVLSSSDTGDTTHSSSWEVDLEQDVAKVVEDQSANGTLLSFWKEPPVPTMKSGAESTVSPIQSKNDLHDDVSEAYSLESRFHQEILEQTRRVNQLCQNTNDMHCVLNHCLSQDYIRNEDEDEVKCQIPEGPNGMKDLSWYDYCHVTIRLWIKHQVWHVFYVTVCQCLSYELWTNWRMLYQRIGWAWLDSCRRRRAVVRRSNKDASLERNSQWKSAVLVMLLWLVVVVGTVLGTNAWSRRNCHRDNNRLAGQHRDRGRMVVLVPMHSSIPVLWNHYKAHHQDHLQQHLLQVESQGVWEYKGSEPALLH